MYLITKVKFLRMVMAILNTNNFPVEMFLRKTADKVTNCYFSFF